jgi:hypothetical protein
MGNEIVGFGGLNFFLVLMSEVRIKYVIRFSRKGYKLIGFV